MMDTYSKRAAYWVSRAWDWAGTKLGVPAQHQDFRVRAVLTLAYVQGLHYARTFEDHSLAGAERARCLVVVQHAREEGETDMRQVRHWIESGFDPREDSG